MLKESRVSILVKALPQRSSTYGETVCCAGVTEYGNFKRLFPVRFRHLAGTSKFARWDWVKFKYRNPTRDKRPESCHVMEDTIEIDGAFPKGERAAFLNRIVSPSISSAASEGRSLALIRPVETKFSYKPKPPSEIDAERRAFKDAAKQGSFFDKELASIEPTPYKFHFKFRDGDGSHTFTNGDWESHAMFFNGRRRTGSDQACLDWMDSVYNEQYVRNGMLFCVGNVASRPQTWQLLGVLSVRSDDQPALL